MTEAERQGFLATLNEDLRKPSAIERAGFADGYSPTKAEVRKFTQATIDTLLMALSPSEEREALLAQVKQASEECLHAVTQKSQPPQPPVAPPRPKEQPTSSQTVSTDVGTSLLSYQDLLGRVSKAVAQFQSQKEMPAQQELINACLDKLKSGDTDSAIKELVHIGEPVVGTLIQALNEQDYHYSDAIKKALEAIGEPAVIPLIHALNDDSPAIREKAAIVLGRMRDSRAVEALIHASKDSEDSVRSVSGWALGQIGDPRAIDPLIRILDFNDPNNYAADALVKIGDPAVEPLIQALSDPNAVVRSYVAYSLGQIRDRRAVHALIKALNDQSDIVRSEIAHALGRIGDRSAIEPLSQMLEDTHSGVRSAAAVALGLNGDSRVLESLCQLLNDHNFLRRRSAAQALGHIPDRRAVEALIQALHDSDWDVRANAATSLGQVADPRAVEPLIQVLKDNSATIQQCAADALMKIGEPAIEALKIATRDKNYHIRKYASWVLRQQSKKKKGGFFRK